ncbi:NAD(P)/FAD-dependent oxidoreductase [Marinoscillum pacificum]|uniref:NAD(P)/FAD-dependent oxidoreductase n=1 Tax=Marinoscillum pacificum TaxID=392723 RepID=UPI0021573A72|nr:NAD(P)/FAD-dependent oxidoreductase [Marinoscillum pacificum]
MSKIVILGNGIAGITAARHIRKHTNDSITVISGESDHFFSRTALMYIYMGHMKYEHTKPYEDWFWAKNKIDLLKAWIKTIDFDSKKLITSTSEEITYDRLILATGSQSNKFGWPGENLRGVQGLYNLQDLDMMETTTQHVKRAVIVGGGLIGVEMAEMLHSRGIHVTYLIRESRFWGNVLPEKEGALIDRHLKEHHIDLRKETELEEIIDDGKGSVKGIKTKSGEVIDCQFVGLTVGVRPNIDFLKDTSLEIDKGILVDEHLATNIPDVYAIGDCAQLKSAPSHRRPIEAVWYVGRMMGETVAKTITGTPTKYQPGIWFNSAKFFDIEYQTYGSVPARLDENHESFYWEAADGKKCIHIVYEKADQKVTGINTFGIRMRHEVWDKWLNDGKTLSYVVEHLPKANFDPEFFKRFEPEIQQQYNEEYGDSIIISKPTFFQRIFN